MADEQNPQSAQVPMDIQQVPLPPMIEALLGELKKDRKRLLKEKAFGDPKQLQQYVGQYLYPRLGEVIRVLAAMSMEGYGLAASNANELRRLHYFTVNELNELGADLDEREARLPGVSADVLNEFQQAFYALGTHLQEKYPDDVDTQGAYNAVAETVGRMVEELMDDYGDDLDEPEGDEPPKLPEVPEDEATDASDASELEDVSAELEAASDAAAAEKVEGTDG